MQRYAVGKRDRRARVAQDVKRPERDPRRFACLDEPFAEPCRVDRTPQLIAENEALTDSEVAAELRAVEDDIANCEAALERVTLARAEQDRRGQQAQAEAETERRDEGMRHARRLEAERRKAARAVDSALRKFAAALRSWDKTTSEQERALRAAGWSAEQAMAARPRSWQVEAAIGRAVRDAKCPAGIVRLEAFRNGLFPSHVKPLGELDAKVLSPVEEER